MKPTPWKRGVLAGLLTLSVTGGTLTPLVVGRAAAQSRPPTTTSTTGG